MEHTISLSPGLAPGYSPPPGRASDYIRHAESEIGPGDKVTIFCRVSYHTQDQSGNLDDQEQNLRREVGRLGAAVVDVVRIVAAGWEGWQLAEAAALAEGLGAKLVAESTSRFIRPLDYHSSENPDAQASEQDLQCVRAWTEGVTLATLLHPDATPAEERSYQTKRGQEAKGRKGGRPAKHPLGFKKERRRETLPVVMRLHGGGASVRKIAEETGVPKSTVHEWVRR